MSAFLPVLNLQQYYDPLDRAQDSKGFSRPQEGTPVASDQPSLPNLWESQQHSVPRTPPVSGGLPFHPSGTSGMGNGDSLASMPMLRFLQEHPEMAAEVRIIGCLELRC